MKRKLASAQSAHPPTWPAQTRQRRLASTATVATGEGKSAPEALLRSIGALVGTGANSRLRDCPVSLKEEINRRPGVGGMAARYHSGYLVSRRRGALSHAEALATENAFTRK
jgi:hypothetical protein